LKLLLDSHVFLWWLADSPKLSARHRAAIADQGSPVLISAATIWELALKISIGRLRLDRLNAERLDEYIAPCGFAELPVSAAHAAAAARLPAHHSDPFDRMLIAQAQIEGVTLVTVDRALSRYDVPLIVP
jgi:PIN domain nuclease of toxin-antitoxin system